MSDVIIYTAPKCPHSTKLKEFLEENNISFEEKNVLTEDVLFGEIKSKTGQMGIPVVDLNGETFVGFDRRTERRLKRKVG